MMIQFTVGPLYPRVQPTVDGNYSEKGFQKVPETKLEFSMRQQLFPQHPHCVRCGEWPVSVQPPPSCPTLYNPRDCSPPGSSIHGILQARMNAGVGYHLILQGIFLMQVLNLHLLHCRQILYHWATGEALVSNLEMSECIQKHVCVWLEHPQIQLPEAILESMPHRHRGDSTSHISLASCTLCSDTQMTQPYGREQRRTKGPPDDSERGEWKAGLKLNIQKTKIMASGPITSWEIDGETVETVSDFIFGGSKITADGDCSHEIKRHLLLGRKVMINVDSILKNRDITLPTNVHLVKAMVFPVVVYGCESWTIKKAENRRIDAFELWCWRRLLRVS